VVLDRAGVTGDDGASHNGMWDLSILQVVPGLRIAVPRDGERLVELLGECVRVSDGPTVLRFPKGPVNPTLEPVAKLGEMDILRAADSAEPDVLLIGVGPMAQVCMDAAALLDAQGITSTVLDPRWVKPLDEALPPAASAHKLVAVVEDNGRVGGVGDAVSRLLRDRDVDVPVRTYGIPQQFLDHAKRGAILGRIGLTGQGVAREITEAVAKRSAAPAEELRQR
jgi:1-deoxy-D-xylulose-5-phosphate synthase